MKSYNTIRNVLLSIILLVSVSGGKAQVLLKPSPATLVTDAAHLLSKEEVHNLEQELVDLDNSSSNQVAIVTIPTLNGQDLETYANSLFREWGIGNKNTNNGVLILVANQEHKIRIEVGYGLEGAIPDVTAKSIIDNDLTPNFKANKYYQGLDLAVNDLAKAAKGEYNVARPKKDYTTGIIVMIFLFFVFIIILASITRNNGREGGMISRRGHTGLGYFLLAGLLSGWNSNSGGSSSWGGGDFSGGDSGGGFGGFGGGSSGGGGASGGW